MKRILILIAAAAMLAVSCQKEIETGGGSCTLTATFEQTKVDYREDGNDLQPFWEPGDLVIGFDNAGNTYELSVTEITEKTATLTGSAVPDGDLHLIYKKGARAADIEGKTLQVNYGAQSGSAADMPAVMLSDGTVTKGNGSFEFRNAGAVVGISAMSGVPVGSAISSVTVKGKNLSTATVKLNGNALELSAGAGSGPGDEISTVALSNVIVNNGGALGGTVFVAVPAGASIASVSASVVTTGGKKNTYAYTLSSEKTVGEGKYLFVKEQAFEKVTVLPEGALPGLFSVSATKKVHFSKGNLQYRASDGKWRFAENQYDVIRDKAGNTTSPDSKRADQTDWIDLFGWGATGRTDINQYLAAPYLTSSLSNSKTLFKTQATPSKDEKLTRENGGDWGVCMGDYWRTLTKEEWLYLISYKTTYHEYENANRAGKYTLNVTVCGVNCFVLAPDTCLNGYVFDSSKTSYSAAEWAVAEAAGLVCMAIGGQRNGDGQVNLLTEAKYWLSTLNSLANASYARYRPGDAYPVLNGSDQARYYGCNVRLVLDASDLQ